MWPSYTFCLRTWLQCLGWETNSFEAQLVFFSVSVSWLTPDTVTWMCETGHVRLHRAAAAAKQNEYIIGKPWELPEDDPWAGWYRKSAFYSISLPRFIYSLNSQTASPSKAPSSACGSTKKPWILTFGSPKWISLYSLCRYRAAGNLVWTLPAFSHHFSGSCIPRRLLFLLSSTSVNPDLRCLIGHVHEREVWRAHSKNIRDGLQECRKGLLAPTSHLSSDSRLLAVAIL